MIIVYVAGPFSASTREGVEALGCELAGAGVRRP